MYVCMYVCLYVCMFVCLFACVLLHPVDSLAPCRLRVLEETNGSTNPSFVWLLSCFSKCSPNLVSRVEVWFSFRSQRPSHSAPCFLICSHVSLPAMKTRKLMSLSRFSIVLQDGNMGTTESSLPCRHPPLLRPPLRSRSRYALSSSLTVDGLVAAVRWVVAEVVSLT